MGSSFDWKTINGDKAIPPLRQWELDSATSSRYEKNIAAPSDDELKIYWSVQAPIALLAGGFTLIVFLGVLSSRMARQQSFNLYLLYLMIPDFSFSLLCAITCQFNAIKGSYWSHRMCNFQQWYCVFGIGSNCWLNAVITRQLHIMLLSSHQRKRYFMPSCRAVTLQALAVYIFCAFLGTWGLFDGLPHFPYHAVQLSGLACVPVEMDKSSSLFFWLFFMPIFAVIPIIYVVYVCVDIGRKKLLPPTGKRRLLALYFGRIVMVFLLLWGPYFLLNYIAALWLPTWSLFVGGMFSHLQGAISAGFSLLKPDIYNAVKRFVTCRCCSDGDETVHDTGHETGHDTGHGDLTDFNGSDETSFFFRIAVAFRRSSRQISGVIHPAVPCPPDLSHTARRVRSEMSSRVSVWPNEEGEYTNSDDEEEFDETNDDYDDDDKDDDDDDDKDDDDNNSNRNNINSVDIEEQTDNQEIREVEKVDAQG